jgi:hypothetical protein
MVNMQREDVDGNVGRRVDWYADLTLDVPGMNAIFNPQRARAAVRRGDSTQRVSKTGKQVTASARRRRDRTK